MDATAVSATVQPGDTLVIGMHPDHADIDLTELRAALPDVHIVVVLGAVSMATYRPAPTRRWLDR